MILTRYLYNKALVVLSLRNTIHTSNYEQAVFWAYELYYSGFQSETLAILLDIYKKRFSQNHPKLGLYIRKKIETTGDECIAIIIKNMMMKNSDILETADVKFVNIKAYHIQKHKTVEPSSVKHHWKYLREVCKYAVCKEKMSKKNRDSHLEIFCKGWLYAASGSPVWKERILACNGCIDIEKETVEFPTDDDFDAFYDRWAVDTEEQPLEVQTRCMGIL